MSTFFLRKQTEKTLLEFLNNPKSSGLTFLRGRRRIGKSSLLKHIQEKHPENCFYFTGAEDETSIQTYARFCMAFDNFTGQVELSLLDKRFLHWGILFGHVNKKIKSSKKKIWVFFDEIQWLAKSRSGFVSLFKEAWLDFEKTSNVSVVLCGSSNKFFIDYVGGEEKVLRGLITHSDIWLDPFTPYEIKNYYGKELSDEQIIFLYMCFGGVPYYYSQLDFSLGFIRGINSALMLKKSIFLSEYKEVLNLDFNNKGLPTIEKIFAGFNARFASLLTIRNKTRLPPSTLSEAMDKLISYGLIKVTNLSSVTKQRKQNIVYYYTDFYLNLYFRFLKKHSSKIKQNELDNLFSGLLTSKYNLYIEGFTGFAFENFVQYCLEELSIKNKFLQSFNIIDKEFAVFAHEKCDIILLSEHEKLIRAIECKWTNNIEIVKEGIKSLSELNFAKEKFKTLKYLVTTCPKLSKIETLARKNGVKIVSPYLVFSKN